MEREIGIVSFEIFPFRVLVCGFRILGDEADAEIELRIHEKTERGDNDTIKMPNGQKVVIDGKKCSDR